MLTREDALQLKRRAVELVQDLSSDVLKTLNPPPGPYALFFHAGFVMELLEDCYRISCRLFEGRENLTELAHEEQRAVRRMPEGAEMSDELNEVLNREHDLAAHMKLDLESLYMFGLVLLDQWALVAIYGSGEGVTKRYPFRNLLTFLQSEQPSRLKSLWEAMRPDLIWLDAHLRVYRNTFIVHRERPWQRGTTRDTFGMTFNFHTPTPPGWLDDATLNARLVDLLPLAPKHIQEAPDDYWEKQPRAVLERLFREIDQIQSDDDRKRVIRLFQEVGGSPPTFQITAERLFRFAVSGTTALIEIVRNDYERVDLGPPVSTDDEAANPAVSPEQN